MKGVQDVCTAVTVLANLRRKVPEFVLERVRFLDDADHFAIGFVQLLEKRLLSFSKSTNVEAVSGGRIRST
jgi:hypothetical protein